MRIYLHSDRAEKDAKYLVTISPAGDIDFVATADVRKAWTHADGRPKQFEVFFKFGVAEVDDSLGKYMVERGIAHRTRLLRQIRQLFNAKGEPIDAFDEHGQPFVLDRSPA